MGEGARRLQHLHHLLEWQLLVLVGSQRQLLGLGQQIGHAGPLGHTQAQGQGVDEEADQAFQLRRLAVRHWHTDDDIVLTAEFGEHDRETRVQDCEQGHAVLARQGAQPGAQAVLQHEADILAFVALDRRARAVERQFQQCRRAAKLELPVIDVVLQ
ncbi:hypothetical protein D3C87_1131940 [compost metagenome]